MSRSWTSSPKISPSAIHPHPSVAIEASGTTEIEPHVIEELSLALPLSRPVETDTMLAALVETYSTLLFRVANSILRNPTEAEDIVQDTFVRVMEHRRALSEVRDTRVWLVRIAWNLALDRRRRIRPEQMDDTFAQQLPSRNLAAYIALDEAQQMQAVFRQIDKLPRAERQALLLSALDELNTPEIAQIMNKTDSAVRALIFRARAHLRDRLEKGDKA